MRPERSAVKVARSVRRGVLPSNKQFLSDLAIHPSDTVTQQGASRPQFGHDTPPEAQTRHSVPKAIPVRFVARSPSCQSLSIWAIIRMSYE